MSETLPLPSSLGQTQPDEPPVAVTPVFGHVPDLKELLVNGGIPGFKYRQICSHNYRRSQDEGWITVPGTFLYQIQGFSGSVDVFLMQKGSKIPGLSRQSGARQCFADPSIEELTGLWINPHKHKGEKIEEKPGPKSGVGKPNAQKP